MRNKFLLSAIFLVLMPVVLFSQSLTLKDAISISLKKNDKILQYNEQYLQKEAEVKESWGNFLPSINFTASYTHLNDNMIIDLSPIRDGIIQLEADNQAEFANIYSILTTGSALTSAQKTAYNSAAASKLESLLPPFTQIFKQQDFKTATIEAIQPLFTGGKILAAKNYAESEKEASKFELKKTQNEIVSETITNFLQVLVMEEVVKIRTSALNSIKKHQKRAQELSDEGVIAGYNVLRANVALAEAEKNLSDDESNLKLAISALKSSLSIDDSEPLEISDSIKFHSINESLEYYTSQARINQPILQIIGQKKIGAEQNYNVVKSSFLPTIAAFGKYELYTEYLSSIEPKWAVGVQLNLNIFNGFKDHMKLQSAQHIENEVMFLESDAKRKIDLWVNKAYKEIDKSKTKFEKLNATITMAKENVRQNEKRFETGMSISLEVIDAHLTYEKVQLDRLVSLYEYYKAVTDLYLACGDPTLILNTWNN